MLQWRDMLDFCRGSIIFHASPSIIIPWNPLAVALPIAHQAASASPRIELPRLIYLVGLDKIPFMVSAHHSHKAISLSISCIKIQFILIYGWRIPFWVFRWFFNHFSPCLFVLFKRYQYLSRNLHRVAFDFLYPYFVSDHPQVVTDNCSK